MVGRVRLGVLPAEEVASDLRGTTCEKSTHLGIAAGKPLCYI
jgi:hypothetical protein